MMMAANLKLGNIIAFLDHNGFQSFGRTSASHPSFYPIKEKCISFGWEVEEVNGHNSEEIFQKVINREGGKPFILIGNTIKGKGVSFMENIPIWHYRSPDAEEYIQAVSEIKGQV
jgi:transketolase